MENHQKFAYCKHLKAWAGYLSKIRRFLEERQYTEVTTPSLVRVGAFEGTIDALRIKVTPEWQLHTSPEIEMKTVLAKSHLPIFQICHCFRDDPHTGQHLKEFTMLEYYKPGIGYRALLEEVKSLFQILSPSPLQFSVFTVRELLLKYTGIDIEPLRSRDEFAKQASGLHVSVDDQWEDIFFKLFTERVEPKLPADEPVFVTDYPVEVAALSSAEGRYVERFECYWKGMEICNGCTELRNATELRSRFERESEIRSLRGKSVDTFPEQLEWATANLPPSAGVAIGLERLFCALTDQRVDALPHARHSFDFP